MIQVSTNNVIQWYAVPVRFYYYSKDQPEGIHSRLVTKINKLRMGNTLTDSSSHILKHIPTASTSHMVTLKTGDRKGAGVHGNVSQLSVLQ